MKTYGFLRFRSVFILSPFPRSPYPCTPIARQPTISALNPFAPWFSVIKNLLFLEFLPYFLYVFLAINSILNDSAPFCTDVVKLLG